MEHADAALRQEVVGADVVDHAILTLLVAQRLDSPAAVGHNGVTFPSVEAVPPEFV